MKRTLSIILSLVLVITLMPSAIAAQRTDGVSFSDLPTGRLQEYDGGNIETLNGIPKSLEQTSYVPQLPAISNRQSNTTRSGIYWIDDGYLYPDNLDSATDIDVYLYQVESAGEYSVYLELPTPEANYSLVVSVYDSTLTQHSDILVSDFDQSFYGSQKLRVEAEADEVIYLEIASIDGQFDPNPDSYSFGILPLGTSGGDVFEINDSVYGSFDPIPVDLNQDVTVSATIDNPFDMDWYVFSYSGTSATLPSFELDSAVPLDLNVWELTSSNNITHRFEIHPGYRPEEIDGTDTERVFYLSVSAHDLTTTGSYTIGAAVSKPHVNVGFVTTNGDSAYQGVHTFGHGRKPMARYIARGQIRAIDSYGNLVPDCDIELSFIADNDGVQETIVVTTGADGTANFVLNVEASVHPYRYTIGNSTYHYDNAVVQAQYAGNDRTTNVATSPFYYLWGITI